jgi:hypothetical protein
VTIPAPRLRRVVLVVLLDRRRRTALLVKWAGLWSPLAARVRGGSSYKEAADEAVRVRAGNVAMGYGAVVGHVWATKPEPRSGARIERRLLLATPVDPLSAGAVRRLAAVGPLPARWWTPGELRESGVPVAPPELANVVDGYWDGWLPDGPLTLEWI